MFLMCYTWKRLTEAQTDVMYNAQFQKPAKVNEAIKVYIFHDHALMLRYENKPTADEDM